MTTLTDRPRAALLVIDVQNDVMSGTHNRDGVIANIVALVDKARAEDVPVVWVQHSGDEMRKEFREFQSSATKGVASITEEIDRTLRQSQEKPKLEPKPEQPIIEPGGEPPPRAPKSRDGRK